MLYVGLDVHSKQITVCVLDERGDVVERTKVRQLDQLVQFLERLPDRFEACFEASTGYGTYYELLRPLAQRVAVAHPGLLKLIFRSKRKNDARDAERLAKLLRLGEVPRVHVPSPEIRTWRETISFRRRLVQKRTRAKNGVRALLRSLVIKPPARMTLWSKKGMAWLKQYEFPHELQAFKRDLLVEEIEMLSEQLQRVEAQLKRFAETQPAVWQLQSIPGVGLRTAEAVVAFLDDPHRFPHSKAIGAYFGLVPGQDQSADRNRLGHITCEGPATVRHLLVEAAWQAQRLSPTVRAFYERVWRNDPDRKKTAVVATAHYLARVMWAMLKNGTLWRETVSPEAA